MIDLITKPSKPPTGGTARKIIAAAVMASIPLIPSTVVFARSASSTSRQHQVLTKPPTLTRLGRTDSTTSGVRPHLLVPFLPRDRAAFTAGRRDRRPAGRNQDVVAIAGTSAAGASHVPLTEQKLAAFPVMDSARQMALYPTDQAYQPPDTQLAAGPVNLAEADNGTLSVWSRSGALLTSADLNAFFGVPPGYSFGDPRILYDQQSGRWFLTGLSFDASADSNEYIAVSTTSDASGFWNVYVLLNATGLLGDQPMIGVSADKAVISWKDFSGSTLSALTFTGQETWILQKSDLVTGAAIHIRVFGPDKARFGIVPALSLSSTTTEWLSYNRGSTIGIIAVDGTPLVGDVRLTESDPAIVATTSPPSPRQPGGIAVTTAIDDRFTSVVWQSGNLWATGNDACTPAGDSTPRSCMKLVEVSTGGTPTVVHDFVAGSIGLDLYFPAVTLDSAADLFIAYSESSPSLDPSAAAVDSLAASPTSLENAVVIASGLRSYVRGTNRWGDYSAAAQDPLDSADVWVTAEYQADAAAAGDWGTATARLAIQPSIANVSPNRGPVNVQEHVTITGARFQFGATVLFGARPATGVVVGSSTQIFADTPTGTAEGPVTVIVNQPDGTSATLPNAYTYTLGAVSQSGPVPPSTRSPVNQSPTDQPGPRASSFQPS